MLGSRMTRAVRLFVNNWLASAKALQGARPRRRRQRTKHVAIGKWISEDFQRQQREPTSGRSWPAEPSCGRECRQDRRRKGSLTAAANALDTSLPTVVCKHAPNFAPIECYGTSGRSNVCFCPLSRRSIAISTFRKSAIERTRSAGGTWRRGRAITSAAVTI